MVQLKHGKCQWIRLGKCRTYLPDNGSLVEKAGGDFVSHFCYCLETIDHVGFSVFLSIFRDEYVQLQLLRVSCPSPPPLEILIVDIHLMKKRHQHRACTKMAMITMLLVFGFYDHLSWLICTVWVLWVSFPRPSSLEILIINIHFRKKRHVILLHMSVNFSYVYVRIAHGLLFCIARRPVIDTLHVNDVMQLIPSEAV